VKFARIVFGLAGVGGSLLLAPLYWMEGRIGAADPPAITHPEYFYGFVGVALTWQIVCLVIAWSPARCRPMMLVAALEKVSFGLAAVAVLTASGFEWGAGIRAA
jgi:hypothetical protein